MDNAEKKKELFDSWNLWEEFYQKKVATETLAKKNNNLEISLKKSKFKEDFSYSDRILESFDNEILHLSQHCMSNEELKNNCFLKTQKTIFNSIKDIDVHNEVLNMNKNQLVIKKNTKNSKVESKTRKMTEYTQNSGLQPAMLKLKKCSCFGWDNLFLYKFNSPGIFSTIYHQSYIKNFKLLSPSTSHSRHFYNHKSICNDKTKSFFSNRIEARSQMNSNDTIYSIFKRVIHLTKSRESFQELSISDCSNLLSIDFESNSQYVDTIFSSHFKSQLCFSRKIYLCAACEIYFENWHLFLHMKDVHDRYICLYCFGMFSQVHKLYNHLTKKHMITEAEFDSLRDFSEIFRNSYIVCYSCEKIFTENDNFHEHYCNEQEIALEYCLKNKKTDIEISCLKLKPVESSSFINSPLTHPKVNSVLSEKISSGIRRHSQRIIKPSKINNVYLYTDFKNISSKKSKQPVAEKNLTSTSNILVANEYKNIESCSTQVFHDTTQSYKIINNSFFNQKLSLSNNPFLNSDLKHINPNSSTNSLKCETNNKVVEVQTKVILKNNDQDEIFENKKINESSAKYSADYNKIPSSLEALDKKKNDCLKISKTNNYSSKGNDLMIGKNTTYNKCKNINSNFDLVTHNTMSPDTSNFNNEEKLSIDLNSDRLKAKSSTDRSLVIKISTKKKTMFSVSTLLSSSSSSSSSASDSYNTVNYKKVNKSEENNNDGMSNSSLSKRMDLIDDESVHNPSIKNYSRMDFFDVNKKDHNLINMNSANYNSLNFIKNCEKKEVKFNDSHDFKEVDSLKNEIQITDEILLAGEEISFVNVNVDNLLDHMNIEDLLKCCLQAVYTVCIYCNHACHIAVNGKQLGLHMLAEHRFQPQHPAIILHYEQLIAKIKKCLSDLESYYITLESYDSENSTYYISREKNYQCFHCWFYCNAHKDLYTHNRKVHQKTYLSCIMCKSTFYSYSELLCHLCPGVYVSNINIQYRCCLCSVTNLPSAFRLMVHLRKKHYACDICLECTENQQRLSNHIWKHKLHHICYKCGITYRNKPDITKHLFWKHGTESVLCKKCLQKKWPYIYHFCIPPETFECEECGLNFSKAVSLKVHKRIHTGEFLHSCLKCREKFISKKLLMKHNQIHGQLYLSTEKSNPVNNCGNLSESRKDLDILSTKCNSNNSEKFSSKCIFKEKFKKVIDIYDLPPLNLSSDTDSETENKKIDKFNKNEKLLENFESPNVENEIKIHNTAIVKSDIVVEVEKNEEEKKEEEQIMDGIWGNFKLYSEESKMKYANPIIKENYDAEDKVNEKRPVKKGFAKLHESILFDHNYCGKYNQEHQNNSIISLYSENEKSENNENIFLKTESSFNLKDKNIIMNNTLKKKKKIKRKKTYTYTSSSDSSSGSDSSSCSCKTSCSCSSSSSTSSSSSSSSNSKSIIIEASQKKANNKLYDQKNKKINFKNNKIISDKEPEIIKNQENCMLSKCFSDTFSESDLNTTETETDEDFYDKYPHEKVQKYSGKKKNLQPISDLANTTNISEPDALTNSTLDPLITSNFSSLILNKSKKILPRKKITKNKKYKRDVKIKLEDSLQNTVFLKSYIEKKTLKTNLISNKPCTEVNSGCISESISTRKKFHCFEKMNSGTDIKRLSKRKRVPKRFYGDSSDEGNYQDQIFKWRKVDFPGSIQTQSIKNPRIKCQSHQPHNLTSNKEHWETSPKKKNILNKKFISTLQRPIYEPQKSDHVFHSSDNESDIQIENENSTLNNYVRMQSSNVIHLKNLYCYCQCPYDEVSEMIACDGHNCKIEWFHFECVGIVMPPKGKWYCPDCQKKLNLLDDFSNKKKTHDC